MLGGSRDSTDGKVIGSDEGIKLGLSGGKLIGDIFGNACRITFGIDVVIDLSSLDGSYDGFNDVKL